MSERSELHGAKAPPTIVHHNGKDYAVPAAFKAKYLLDLEQFFFQRATEALAMQRGAYTEPQYLAELRLLRKQFEAGEYSFESEPVQEVLGTKRGALMFFSHVLGIPEDECLDLLAAKKEELMVHVESAIRNSFPDSDPKAEAVGAPPTTESSPPSTPSSPPPALRRTTYSSLRRDRSTKSGSTPETKTEK